MKRHRNVSTAVPPGIPAGMPPVNVKQSVHDKQSFSRWESWIKERQKTPPSITPHPILLIHDADGDGICSGKILKEGLEKLGIPVTFRFAAFDRTGLFGPFLLDFISKRQIQSILVTDINLLHTNYPQHREALGDKTIIVFDHHEIPPLSALPRTMIYIHPATMFGFPAPSQYCSSKLVYDVLSQSTGADLSSLNWAASIGIVSDASYTTWKQFVDSTLEELGMGIPSSPYDSELQRVGTLLYYGLAMERKEAQKAVHTMFAAKSYEQALQKLEKYAIVGGEVDHYLAHWKEFAEFHGDIVFIVLKSKYKINSLVSSKLSFQYPEKTFVVASPSKQEEGPKHSERGEKSGAEERSGTRERFMNMSLRRQDNTVDLPALLKEISSRIEGFTGGGHIPAAGARCRLEDYASVKELLVKLHGEV